MDCIALLRKYYSNAKAFYVVYEHSRLVAAKARAVARRIGLDEEAGSFVQEAALLHDIGVCRTDATPIFCYGREPYIRHGLLGREILEAEGLPRHAIACERHIGVGITVADIRQQQLPLPERDMSPRTVEERIVCFADLFYSKNPGYLTQEKPIAMVRENLGRFSAAKVRIFDAWLAEFSPNESSPA